MTSKTTDTVKIESRCRPHYPTACCELFHVSTSALLTCAVQIFLIVLIGLTYYTMERNGYFYNIIIFRVVITTVGILYFTGICLAIVGIAFNHTHFVLWHKTIIKCLMFFTDVVAASVVLTMAIGNRNAYIESIPHKFVNSEKFYAKLGPFWMYLGAITLHITVAFNMCFLQVFNNYLSYSKIQEVVPASQPCQKEANNNL